METSVQTQRRGTRGQFLFVTGLTFARAPLILLFMIGAVVAEFHPITWLKWLNLALMAASAITDMFDGMLARKWHVTSKFGAVCDPFTDKVFYLVVFPTLTALLFNRPFISDVMNNPESGHGVLMLFFTVMYLLRDQWVSALRTLASGKADMRANWVGKFRTALSFPIGCLLYVYIAFGWSWLSRPLMMGLEILAILVNFYSIYAYTKRYGFALRESMNS